LDDLDIDREKVIINLDRYGNTSAGSMPLVLDEAWRQGRIHRGDQILLSGFGGGLAWGSAVMKW
jgi:3-oxoacyl-[acyl-carrier-protein] synthase-3